MARQAQLCPVCKGKGKIDVATANPKRSDRMAVFSDGVHGRMEELPREWMGLAMTSSKSRGWGDE